MGVFKDPLETLRECVDSFHKRMIKYYGSEEAYVSATKELREEMDEVDKAFNQSLIKHLGTKRR